MAGETILIIDDDMHHLQLLQQVFIGESYTVSVARNAEEAIAELEKRTPDLIILDLILPDMDGYALLETIKANPNWRMIPVVIVSSRQSMEDKLRGLRLGVMDYITKPFEREELKARIRNLLDFYKLKIQRPTRSNPDSHQRLLDFMRERGIRALVPKVCRKAKLGYIYPEAAEVLKPEVRGAEIFTLETMARARLLERVFHDTIHLCPKCGHHDLNFREVCPHCDYADIEQKRFITHLGCGYRGPEAEFQQEQELRCPQCFDLLHQLGEDYEVNGSAFHICNGCKEEFTDPVVNCRCMNCDHIFDVSATVVRRVYAYKLVSDNKEEWLPDPTDQGSPGEMHDFIDLIHHYGLPYAPYEEFVQRIDSELSRSKDHPVELSLISIQFHREQWGNAAERANFGIHCIEILNNILRESDMVTLKSATNWLIFLPATPFRMAKILAERLQYALSRSDIENPFEINMASYPEDGSNARELLEILKLGLVKF